MERKCKCGQTLTEYAVRPVPHPNKDLYAIQMGAQCSVCHRRYYWLRIFRFDYETKMIEEHD